MKTSLILAAPAALMLLAGCEKAEAPAPADTMTTDVPVETAPMGEEIDSAAASHRFASWAGRWTGPEGLYVAVTPAAPGRYRLEMQSDLDTKGVYDGQDSEHGIRFRRGGEWLSLHRGSGDESGLKYLAGKQECLVVKAGEGYCRD